MIVGRAYVQGCQLRDSAGDRLIAVFDSHQMAVEAMNALRDPARLAELMAFGLRLRRWSAVLQWFGQRAAAPAPARDLAPAPAPMVECCGQCRWGGAFCASCPLRSAAA